MDSRRKEANLNRYFKRIWKKEPKNLTGADDAELPRPLLDLERPLFFSEDQLNLCFFRRGLHTLIVREAPPRKRRIQRICMGSCFQ